MLSKKTRRNLNRILTKHNKLITAVVVFGTLAFFMTKSVWKRHFLMKEHLITSGVITDYNYAMKGGALTFYYSYEVDGKQYAGTSGHPVVMHAYASYFIGKRFPVTYEKGRPENYRMLITTLDFKEFSIPFPDSLKWVIQYQKRD